MQKLRQTLSDAVVDPSSGLMDDLNEQATHDRFVEFANLMAHALPRFQRMAMRWLHSREDAEDAVQDALLSAFTHLSNFGGRARMSSWVISIVINSVRMHLRKRRRKALPLDQVALDGSCTVAEMLPEPGRNPEQTCQQAELHTILALSIGQLSPTQRNALELYALKGLSLKEAAETLGIPVGTLKAQLARGRRRLSQKPNRVLGPSRSSARNMHDGSKPLAQKSARLSKNLRATPLQAFANSEVQPEDVPNEINEQNGIAEVICFAVMEVAAEGSPVPA
jgi:RNA polymerase sigma-70 factor (ECF subfamily)